MKKQKLRDLSKLLKASILVVFLSVEFFGNIPTGSADASNCKFTVQSFEFQSLGSDPAVVSHNSRIKIFATVSRQGNNYNDCHQYDTYFNYLVKIKTSPGYYRVFTVTVPKSNPDDVLTDTETVDLSSFPWASLSDPNKFEYYMTILYVGSTTGGTNNWGKSLKVTGGSGGANGSLYPLQISFPPGVSTVSPSDNNVTVYISPTNGSDLLKFTDDIKILTYVNGKWNGLQQTRSRSDCGGNFCLAGNSTYQDIPITADMGFQDRTDNKIKVDIYPSSSNQPLAEGTAQIAVQGIGSTPPPGGGPSNGLCSACFADAGCASKKCDLNSKQCVPSNGINTCAGSECYANAGCASNNCNLTTNTCVGNGSPPGGGTTKPPGGGVNPPGGTTPTGGSVANCTSGKPDPANCLYNPLAQDDLTHVFLSILKGFVGIVAIWATLFIIIGGFQLVTAAGNEEMYTKGKKTIVWAVLGLVVAVLSFTIIAVVQNLLNVTTYVAK